VNSSCHHCAWTSHASINPALASAT